MVTTRFFVRFPSSGMVWSLDKVMVRFMSTPVYRCNNVPVKYKIKWRFLCS
jgi:hypothetical protein